jgi:sugar phosphate isomerase/epimerase
MNRREFFVGVAGVAGAAAANRSWAKGGDQGKLARLAIMSLSFGNILKNANQPDDPARTIDLMDIGQMYADRFGIHNVELQHTHIPSTEQSWLKEFRARLAKTKSQVTNINLEFGALTISAPEPVLRLQAVDLTKMWIDHAATLGCPRVMVNQGLLNEQSKQVAIAALKLIGNYGKAKRIMVGVENRSAPRTTPRGTPATPATPPVPPAPPAPIDYTTLVEVIKAAGVRANCDLGNFNDQESQLAGIRAMFPLTDGNCHVKLNPARYDVPKALALTRELGYKGLYSIEASTNMGPDPYQNTQKILDVILANI